MRNVKFVVLAGMVGLIFVGPAISQSESDINAKVAQLDIDTATLDDVIRIFGEPEKYLWGGQTFAKNNLPSTYIAAYYSDSLHIVMSRGKVSELRFEGPDTGYVFRDKIRAGTSLDEVLKVVGQPNMIVKGQKLPPLAKDGVLYKDIGGEKGYCYYRRADQDIQIFFLDYEVSALYIIPADMEVDGKHTFRPIRPVKSVKEFDDVRWKDLSKINLGRKCDFIKTLTFNKETIWPKSSRMPKRCDPDELLTKAMNPGLGVRKLHEQGITGKGVNVAIIDQPMYLDHPEFVGKILKYYDTGCGSQSSMHGPAVASLLVGTNCGTAPDARVYYAAVPSWKRDTAYEAKALNWIIEENKDLPASQKIRVVSVSAASSSPNVRDKNQHMWGRARARAEAAGIMVLDCTSEYGFIGKCWYNARVPESVRRCTPGDPRYDFNITDHLLVPSAPRTTAEEYDKGDCSYQYCGSGGLSWSIPYCAGVLALGWQIRPDLTQEQMRELLFKSAYEKRKGLNVKVSNAKEFFRSASERKKKGEEIGKPERSRQRVRRRDGNGAKIINPEKFIRIVRMAKATRRTRRSR